MRIYFSEPECSNCYHCRTLGVLNNTQESEPSNVIGSSVTSVPVSSGPVQALGHDSAAVGSTSTSYPVKALGQASAAVGSAISFGTPLAATTSVISEPAQSVAPTISSYGGFGCPSQIPPAFQFGSAPAFTFHSSAPTQAIGPTTFGFGAFPYPTPPSFGTMQYPVQVSASSTSTNFCYLPAHNFGKPASASLFGNGVAFARPDVGYSPLPSSSTTTAISGVTPVSVSSVFGPTQAPVQASAFSTSTFLPFGCGPTFSRSSSSLFTSGFGSPSISTSSNLFGPKASTTSSVFGSPTDSVRSQFGSEQDSPNTTDPDSASSTEKTPLNSCFPGFDVGGFPGSTTTPAFGGGLIGGGVKTSSPQPFGFGAATKFCSNSNIASHSFSPHEWSPHTEQGSRYPGYSPHDWSVPTGYGGCLPSYSPQDWSLRNEQGSRYPGYSPTPVGDGQSQIYISISASDPYLHKSHEELRWEDYKQGVKDGSFPDAHASPISSRPDTVFSPSTLSPSNFNYSSIPHYQYPPTGLMFPSSSSPSFTTVPPINSSVQRPHETAAVSSPAPGCTACGATTSSSDSGYFTYNGATTPPSAATYLPELYYPSSPMMFVTTPALQAYPVQGYILLPLTALSLQ